MSKPTKYGLPKFNEKLYDQVIEHILEEPKRLDMDTYALSPDDIEELGKSAPKCGTVACFAGWAVAIKKHWRAKQLDKHYDDLGKMAEEMLGLTHAEADELFLPTNWSLNDRVALGDSPQGSKPYAKAVAKYAKKFKTQIKAARKEK